jgi:hypothetical protein
MELALAFERSAAIERLERFERASVLNSADPGCGDFDPAGFPSANPTSDPSLNGFNSPLLKKD